MLKRLAILVLLLPGTPAWADPAVWAAHGPNATVYLLGSVHLLRPGTVWEGPAVRRAFDEARECWFEAVLPDDPAAMQAVMMSTGLDPAHKLSDLLPPNRRVMLDKLAAESGAGPAMQAMRPWLAAAVLTSQPLLKAGFDPALGVDTVLQAQAKAAGKRVAGVETMDQQMRLMAGLPQGLAVKFLLSAMDDAAKGPAQIDEMIRGWQSADTEALARTFSGQVRRESLELYQIIFVDRNETFARAVEGFLAGDKTVLLVIGAGHLAGPDNVRDVLKRRGIKVERIPD
ncbi:MAG TPA: TraB/GumN family protein [Acetobacteraceae bacterium]